MILNVLPLRAILLNWLISHPTADVARANKFNCHIMLAVNHEAIRHRLAESPKE